jgi:hypothetical protein
VYVCFSVYWSVVQVAELLVVIMVGNPDPVYDPVYDSQPAGAFSVLLRSPSSDHLIQVGPAR